MISVKACGRVCLCGAAQASVRCFAENDPLPEKKPVVKLTRRTVSRSNSPGPIKQANV